MILFIQSNIEYVVWPITLIILFIAFISVIVIFGIIESRNQAVEKYSEPINKLKQINKSLSFDNLDANRRQMLTVLNSIMDGLSIDKKNNIFQKYLNIIKV